MGNRIGTFTGESLASGAANLIFKINVSTGWKMPDDAAYLNVLISEFALYLTENCSDMTFAEVSFAVRNYGLEIKDWGKSMNLSLINEPILAYRAARKVVSEIEESLKTKEVLLELPPAPVDWSSHWNDILDAARKGQEKIIILPIYDWLVETGQLNLTNDEKKILFDKAKNIYRAEYGYAVQTGSATPQIKAILNNILTDEITEDLKVKIGNRAKRLAVKAFAKNRIEMGY
jgi:hypothetical protein